MELCMWWHLLACSYHNSPPVHILHASKWHHTHSSIYLHSPPSSTVHLCWCKRSVKSQTMDTILQCRPNVTALLMAVLSTLKLLYRIGQSSSYHSATISVSVLCPISSLSSVTSKDSCNVPSCFHMAIVSSSLLPQYHPIRPESSIVVQQPSVSVYAYHKFQCTPPNTTLSGVAKV
jgi:hypothetical protein